MFETTVFPKGSQSFIDPDVVYVRVKGPGNSDLVTTKIVMAEAIRSFALRPGELYWFFDIAGVGGMSSDARSWLLENVKKPLHARAVLLVGASFSARFFARLIFRGLILLGRWNAPVLFFDTDGEAWRWVEKDRLKKTARNASSPSLSHVDP